MNTNKKAIIFVLLCVFLWALIPVVAKLGQNNLDSHQFLFWSSLVSFFTLFLVSAFQKKLTNFKSYSTKNIIQAGSLGILGTYLYYILLYFGYSHGQGIEVLVIQYSWPVFVVILSVFILKEKFSAKLFISILLGFSGVLVVLTKGNFSNLHLGNLKTNLLVLTAAFVFGLFSVLSKKVRLEPYTLNTIYFFTATVFSLISMLVLSTFQLPSKSSLFPILINGIFVNGLSYVFWIKALKSANASFVAMFVFLTPVLSAIFLIVFFHEKFIPVYIAGMGLVILGGLLNRK